MEAAETLKAEFARHFGDPSPLVIRAPGRVNLIGEHTDYNDGFVLPMAIDRAVWLAIRPRGDQRVLLHSLDLGTVVDFALDGLARGESGPAEYVKGVAWVLRETGRRLTGFEGVLQGNVPIGAGLSSSAALEIATARAFAAVSGFEWEPMPMASAVQRAENEWVGVRCGIMDPMISAAGRADHALLIDCRSLETDAVPLPRDVVVWVMDTSTRRGLVHAPYNERREQCRAAAHFFGVRALRDVSLELHQERGSEMDDVIRRRVRHVVSENERVLGACRAMVDNDLGTLGVLLRASHESLRDDFEVSSRALDCIVDVALEHSACWGARMTGAGFGGCAIALVRREAATSFEEHVRERYWQLMNVAPRLFVCEAAAGASILDSAASR